MSRLLLAGFVLLAACSDTGMPTAAGEDAAVATTATANAADVTKTVFEQEGSFTTGPLVAACTGEQIRVDYRMKLMMHERQTPDGAFLGTFHLVETGAGTGLTTGRQYSYKLLQGEGVRIVEGTAYRGTAIFQRHFIGQGAGGNFVVLNTFHFTRNADGEFTVERNEFSTECR